MMEFKLIIDIIFEATNLDDAFKKLENHFKFLQDPENLKDPKLILKGKIDLKKHTELSNEK